MASGWGPARRPTRRRRSYIRRRPWPRPCPPQRPAREAATRAPRWQPVLFATRRASATTVVSSPIYSYRPPPLCPSKGCRSSHQGGFGHLWSLDGERVSSTFRAPGSCCSTTRALPETPPSASCKFADASVTT
eukprot:scaffold63121_cov69-Phaeocystis_antarctica.AAC.2